MSEATTPLDIVTRMFEALAVCDLDAAAPYLAEDVDYRLINLNPRHIHTFEDREAFLGLRAQVDRVSNGTYRFDIHSITAAGPELVIVHAQTHASFEDRSGGGHWVIVARVIDGRIVQMTDTPETALDLFWRPRTTAS